jgi:hypothetical protein
MMSIETLQRLTEKKKKKKQREREISPVAIQFFFSSD